MSSSHASTSSPSHDNEDGDPFRAAIFFYVILSEAKDLYLIFSFFASIPALRHSLMGIEMLGVPIDQGPIS